MIFFPWRSLIGCLLPPLNTLSFERVLLDVIRQDYVCMSVSKIDVYRKYTVSEIEDMIANKERTLTHVTLYVCTCTIVSYQ
jgi:hypothetical protein